MEVRPVSEIPAGPAETAKRLDDDRLRSGGLLAFLLGTFFVGS